MSEHTAPLAAIADKLRQITEQEVVSVDDIVTTLGPGSSLPLVLVTSLIVVSPASGIPGLPTVVGLLIALVSAERMLNFEDIYLPGALRRRYVKGKTLRSGLDRMQPVIDWFDRNTRNRLGFLFHRPLIYLPLALSMVSGLAMPFLEVIPFSSSIVATGVFLLTMSLLTRDGLFFLLAMIPYGGLALLIVGLVP